MKLGRVFVPEEIALSGFQFLQAQCDCIAPWEDSQGAGVPLSDSRMKELLYEAVVAILIICGYALAANQERIVSVGPTIVLLVVILNITGYLAGWYLGALYWFEYERFFVITNTGESEGTDRGSGRGEGTQVFPWQPIRRCISGTSMYYSILTHTRSLQCATSP